jgi:hypothetical protein
MNRKILLLSSLIIIIVLTACNDRDYITGQIGPSRGIVFNIDDCDLEAQIYKDNDDMSFITAENSAKTLSVSTSWNKSTSDFRLPTEYEAETIMNNEYSKALWSENDQPQTSYIWCEGNVAYNYETKQIDTEVSNASLLVVRDLYSCEN